MVLRRHGMTKVEDRIDLLDQSDGLEAIACQLGGIQRGE